MFIFCVLIIPLNISRMIPISEKKDTWAEWGWNFSTICIFTEGIILPWSLGPCSSRSSQPFQVGWEVTFSISCTSLEDLPLMSLSLEDGGLESYSSRHFSKPFYSGHDPTFLNKRSLGFWTSGVFGLDMFKLPNLSNNSTKFTTFPWSRRHLTHYIKHSLLVHM